MSKLPNSQFARASVVGSTAVKLGVGKLKTKAKRPFLSASAVQDVTEKQHDEEAALLFKAITQLRGTAVKLAQMLGMESDLLPQRVRDELSKSYHQVPPLNRVLVNKVLESEFDQGPAELFKTFDGEAMAAASLGQVHKAELQDGRIVAVKVQYPGIHVSIDSDLKLLRKLAAGGVQLLPKNRRPNKQVIETSIDEIGLRLKEETDYRLEAYNTRWFAENLHIQGIQIPQVYEPYCSERVLTTEMLEGKHLDDWLAGNPSQELRDKAAQLIYDLFFVSTMEYGKVHADPNPGNYLFKDNGDIALIDFGCVKTLGARFTEHLPKLLFAFYQRDFDQIVEAYAAIGMTMSDSVLDFEHLMGPFSDWLGRPFQETYFDFKVNDTYTSEGVEHMRALAHTTALETVEEDFIFFDRTLYGLFKIFERLQARVCFRGHWEMYWNK